jgi:polyphosphate kinase
MAKKDKHSQRAPDDQEPPGAARLEAGAGPPPKMKRKEYERQMRVLHGELVAMQDWVKATGAKICVVFEGRDTAGKGGTIKRITERVSPRVFRVVALPAPTEREKSQMYVQRYLPHFPAAGEVVIFDRSWYNRAGVEPVMGFCTPAETGRFLQLAPLVEKAMTDDGILLLKYWLEVSPRRGRLNIITHLLSQVPYTPPAPRHVTLPRRQPAHGYVQPDLPLHYIRAAF